MPRKVFTAGEVLAASDVNSFLMNQTVMVFAGTAARGSAIPSPTEGMYVHLNDTDALQYYNGSAWVSAIPSGLGIKQVVSTAKTDTFTMSSGSFEDVTGLSVSITPTSATSKILVSLTVNAQGGLGVSGLIGRIVRNSTAIAIGDGAGSRERATFGPAIATGNAIQMNSAMTFLDSPATTSATTYKLQVKSDNPGVLVYVNRSNADVDSSANSRLISTITVMEVAV